MEAYAHSMQYGCRSLTALVREAHGQIKRPAAMSVPTGPPRLKGKRLYTLVMIAADLRYMEHAD